MPASHELCSIGELQQRGRQFITTCPDTAQKRPTPQEPKDSKTILSNVTSPSPPVLQQPLFSSGCHRLSADDARAQERALLAAWCRTSTTTFRRCDRKSALPGVTPHTANPLTAARGRPSSEGGGEDVDAAEDSRRAAMELSRRSELTNGCFASSRVLSRLTVVAVEGDRVFHTFLRQAVRRHCGSLPQLHVQLSRAFVDVASLNRCSAVIRHSLWARGLSASDSAPTLDRSTSSPFEFTSKEKERWRNYWGASVGTIFNDFQRKVSVFSSPPACSNDRDNDARSVSVGAIVHHVIWQQAARHRLASNAPGTTSSSSPSGGDVERSSSVAARSDDDAVTVSGAALVGRAAENNSASSRNGKKLPPIPPPPNCHVVSVAAGVPGKVERLRVIMTTTKVPSNEFLVVDFASIVRCLDEEFWFTHCTQGGRDFAARVVPAVWEEYRAQSHAPRSMERVPNSLNSLKLGTAVKKEDVKQDVKQDVTFDLGSSGSPFHDHLANDQRRPVARGVESLVRDSLQVIDFDTVRPPQTSALPKRQRNAKRMRSEHRREVMEQGSHPPGVGCDDVIVVSSSASPDRTPVLCRTASPVCRGAATATCTSPSSLMTFSGRLKREAEETLRFDFLANDSLETTAVLEELGLSDGSPHRQRETQPETQPLTPQCERSATPSERPEVHHSSDCNTVASAASLQEAEVAVPMKVNAPSQWHPVLRRLVGLDSLPVLDRQVVDAKHDCDSTRLVVPETLWPRGVPFYHGVGELASLSQTPSDESHNEHAAGTEGGPSTNASTNAEPMTVKATVSRDPMSYFPYSLLQLRPCRELNGEMEVVARGDIPCGTVFMYAGALVDISKAPAPSTFPSSNENPTSVTNKADGEANNSSKVAGSPTICCSTGSDDRSGGINRAVSQEEADEYGFSVGQHLSVVGRSATRYINHRYGFSPFGNVAFVTCDVPRPILPIAEDPEEPDPSTQETKGAGEPEKKRARCDQSTSTLHAGGSVPKPGRGRPVGGARKNARFVQTATLNSGNKDSLPLFVTVRDIRAGERVLATTYGEPYDARLEREVLCSGLPLSATEAFALKTEYRRPGTGRFYRMTSPSLPESVQPSQAPHHEAVDEPTPNISDKEAPVKMRLTQRVPCGVFSLLSGSGATPASAGSTSPSSEAGPPATPVSALTAKPRRDLPTLDEIHIDGQEQVVPTPSMRHEQQQLDGSNMLARPTKIAGKDSVDSVVSGAYDGDYRCAIEEGSLVAVRHGDPTDRVPVAIFMVTGKRWCADVRSFRLGAELGSSDTGADRPLPPDTEFGVLGEVTGDWILRLQRCTIAADDDCGDRVVALPPPTCEEQPKKTCAAKNDRRRAASTPSTACVPSSSSASTLPATGASDRGGPELMVQPTPTPSPFVPRNAQASRRVSFGGVSFVEVPARGSDEADRASPCSPSSQACVAVAADVILLLSDIDVCHDREAALKLHKKGQVVESTVFAAFFAGLTAAAREGTRRGVDPAHPSPYDETAWHRSSGETGVCSGSTRMPRAPVSQ